MNKTRSAFLIALLFAALCLAAAAPAHAITFATGQGTDSDTCGAANSPCRTLEQAVTNAPAGGYVLLQGPADFGGAEINKAISIVGESGATASGASAPQRYGVITIDAGANDVVRLRGLTTTDAPLGGSGVLWVRGKGLEIAHCVIQRGVQPMLIQGGEFVVVDSVIDGIFAGSQNAGIRSYFDGLRASGEILMGGGSSTAAKTVLVNSSAGRLQNDNGDLIARNVVVSNGGNALTFRNSGSIHLSRSTVTGNAKAIDAQAGEGALFTYGDNVIRGNADETLSRTSCPAST